MDRERIAAFLERFVGYTSGATTIALLAVADRSGLLSWLGEHGSGTAAEIAVAAGLERPYVQEVLSGLAAAGSVEYDPATETFSIPPEHALFLSEPDSPYYMGGWFDMIPELMKQVDGVANAARNGGGVGSDEFGPEMTRGIDRANTPSQKVFLTNRWLAAVPGLIDRLETGIRVADIGCGSGSAALLMAQAFPESEVTGFDISAEALQRARSRAGSLGNLVFEESPADSIPLQPPFQLITAFDVIHDLADPGAGLERIRSALSPDGVFLMMEPNLSSRLEDNMHDIGALIYGMSALHCMTQSLAADGEGLGAAWGRERAEDYARKAGFSTFEPLGGITNKFSAFYLLQP